MALQLIVISGLGGSGKTTALRALEDLGVYCVDNLPALLFGQLIALIRTRPDISRVAVVADARECLSLDEAVPILERLRAQGLLYELLFLDSDDDTLVRRYSETRRRHPLADVVRDGIARERTKLQSLREIAQLTINTSELTPTSSSASSRVATSSRPSSSCRR